MTYIQRTDPPRNPSLSSSDLFLGSRDSRNECENDNAGKVGFERRRVYIRALIVSFLLHSLAFAGSYVLLNQYFTAHNTSNIQQSFLTVSFVNETHDPKVSPPREVLLSPKKVTKNLKSSKSLKTSQAGATSASPSYTQNAATQTVFERKENGDGGANLIPHPENQPPSYPESARKEGLTGHMVLELTVNERGLVDYVEIKEGKDTPEILKITAMNAVKIWRFLYKISPKAPTKIQVPVVFSLT
jgi:TonB family protein